MCARVSDTVTRRRSGGVWRKIGSKLSTDVGGSRQNLNSVMADGVLRGKNPTEFKYGINAIVSCNVSNVTD